MPLAGGPPDGNGPDCSPHVVPLTVKRMSDQQWTAGSGDAGVRLDKYLAAGDRAGSRAGAAQALERGKVFVNGTEVALQDAARRLVEGDVVRLWADRPGSARRRPRLGVSGELDVVHEDDALIVVNKPAGILSVPLERNPGVPSVYAQIEERFRPLGKRRPFVVHRIDQDTSGLVVFAKDPTARDRLRLQFAKREPERVYLAVVYGRPEPARGVWRDTLVWDEKALIQKETHPRDPRGSEAISEYRDGRDVPGRGAGRGPAADGTAQPDQDPGTVARAHPRRRTALCIRAGRSFGRFASGARRCTRSGSGSTTPTTAGRCVWKRRCRPTSMSC